MKVYFYGLPVSIHHQQQLARPQSGVSELEEHDVNNNREIVS